MRRGFTLIELMLVVVILGALAAIALPNFLRMQCRAKQSEARVVVNAIESAMRGYHAETDVWVGLGDLVSFGGLDVNSLIHSRVYNYSTVSMGNGGLIFAYDGFTKPMMDPTGVGPITDAWTRDVGAGTWAHSPDGCLR